MLTTVLQATSRPNRSVRTTSGISSGISGLPTSRSAGSISDHAPHGASSTFKAKATRVPSSVGAGSGKAELQRAHGSGAPRVALSDRSNVPSRTSSIPLSADDAPTKLGKHSRTSSALSSDGASGQLKAKVTATALAARRRLGSGISSTSASGGSTAAPQVGPARSRSSSSASLSTGGSSSHNLGLGLRRTRGGSINGARSTDSVTSSSSTGRMSSDQDRTIRRAGSSTHLRAASSSAVQTQPAAMDVDADSKGKARAGNGFEDIAEVSAEIDRRQDGAAPFASGSLAADGATLQNLAQVAMAAASHLDDMMSDDDGSASSRTQLLDDDAARGSVHGRAGWTETDATTPRPDDLAAHTPTPSSPCLDEAEGEDPFQEPNLDPEHIFSLPPDMEAAAQRAVAAIKARYETEVLVPALERARAERAEAVRQGTMTAAMAEYENNLSAQGLDPDEVRDTTMVAEYAEEVFAYMAQCEKTTMANPHYMNFQNEMNWSMRMTLIDWLMQIHVRYHMLPETLWIAINLADRFLSVRVVSLAKLQLVGVTAMFIAAKYEEILAPTVDDLVRLMTNSGYTRDEILKGERIILSTLEFNVSKYCSPYSWVRRISKADEYDIQTRTLCKFLIECTLLDHRFLRVKPSTIAAIGMFLAKKMLGGEWNDAFVYYSGFTAEQLLPGANLLLERLLDPAFEEMFVCRKYSIRKFLRASVFAREWVRAHAGGSLNPAAVAALQQQQQQQQDGDVQDGALELQEQAMVA
ncbi:B-type cyclin [Tilletia horrida]|uniref:B-type cyclin n=1 Tax=Tilletia horrida TaxID=155126 RepID=A0AAN6G8T1_9BASI|nr:B-type cyclin [Tilletia horrida]KAK0522123.1 B-type cyclin [Tilletia horrida]KAK0544721.1 B-type cyclin [Tilletia horrida]